jgi:hypothetical protein
MFPLLVHFAIRFFSITAFEKKSDLEKKRIIELLKEYVRDHKEIIFALLFGSLVHPIVPGVI